jgi:leucyl-tRNA synthetase
MAVPAHDTRDHDFAKQFGLPIKTVITADDQSTVPPSPLSLFFIHYHDATDRLAWYTSRRRTMKVSRSAARDG